MIQKIITIVLLMQIPVFMDAQNEEPFEIQLDKVDSNASVELQKFYAKFNSWIDSIVKGSGRETPDEKGMVHNFVMFSEDGLIMKDREFHTVASCKKQILADLPSGENAPKWIYVTMESHVNKRDLIQILEFLKEQNIEYQFGEEDEFVPKIRKQ